MKNTNQEKILADYEKKAGEIIDKMLNVFVRAQRKTDDLAYRKIIEKFQQKT